MTWVRKTGCKICAGYCV